MKKDGGPAFPHTFDMVNGGNTRGGMSLRAYFAAHAPITVQDAVAVCGFREPMDWNEANRGTIMAILSLMCKEHADALIAELERE